MNNFLLFLLLIFLSLGFGFLIDKGLDMDSLVYNSLGERFANEQINEVFGFYKKWSWASYIVIPFYLFIKVAIIASIIDIGVFFFDKEIKYKKLFNFVLKAEFIFLLILVFKFIWFYVFDQNYNLDDIQYFYPLSALSFIGSEGLEPWWIYPFQTLNLFELGYWFILAYLIGKEINSNTEKGLTIVASSYGIGLLIWVVGVMFLTLNMS